MTATGGSCGRGATSHCHQHQHQQSDQNGRATAAPAGACCGGQQGHFGELPSARRKLHQGQARALARRRGATGCRGNNRANRRRVGASGGGSSHRGGAARIANAPAWRPSGTPARRDRCFLRQVPLPQTARPTARSRRRQQRWSPQATIAASTGTPFRANGDRASPARAGAQSTWAGAECAGVAHVAPCAARATAKRCPRVPQALVDG